MFERIKKYFSNEVENPVTETPAVPPPPPQFYELEISFLEGNKTSIIYSDVAHYNFRILAKSEHLDIDLTFKDGSFKQIYFNKNTWFHIEGRKQEIKLADYEQVKAAWAPPIERKLPEFPVTLDSQ